MEAKGRTVVGLGRMIGRGRSSKLIISLPEDEKVSYFLKILQPDYLLSIFILFNVISSNFVKINF